MPCIVRLDRRTAELVWKYAIKPGGNTLKITLNMNWETYNVGL